MRRIRSSRMPGSPASITGAVRQRRPQCCLGFERQDSTPRVNRSPFLQMTPRPARASVLLFSLALLLAGLIGHRAFDPFTVDLSAQAAATIASDQARLLAWRHGHAHRQRLDAGRNRHHRPAPPAPGAARHRADGGGRRERNDYEHVVRAVTGRPRCDLLRNSHGIAVWPASHHHLRRQGKNNNLGRRSSPRTGTHRPTGTRLSCPAAATTSRFRPTSQAPAIPSSTRPYSPSPSRSRPVPAWRQL